MIIILIITLLIAVAYALPLVFVYFYQRRIIFKTTRALHRDPGLFHWAFEEVLLPVNGEETHGWFIPLENARGWVLFSHGNAGNIADRLESIGLLRELGFSVLAYDYGGYGKSTGKCSEQRCYADIEAMWRYPDRSNAAYRQSRLCYLGGRWVAALPPTWPAAQVKPAAVILESTFLSMPEAAQEAFPWFPIRYVIRHRFPNCDNVRQCQAPPAHHPQPRRQRSGIPSRGRPLPGRPQSQNLP